MPSRKVQPKEISDAVVKALPGELDVDTVLVDQAVQDLNRLYLAKGLETARAVGEYVVEKFLAGEAGTFEAAQRDHRSLAALSERKDLRVSKSFLWYSVRLLPQLQLLPPEIGSALPMSHHRLLVHVADAKAKEQLARKAVEKDLSKRQLEDEIRKAKARRKAGKPSKAGRPALPAFQKTISRLRKILDRGDEAFADLDKVEALSTAEALSLYQAVTGMKLKCEELQKELQEKAGL